MSSPSGICNATEWCHSKGINFSNTPKFDHTVYGIFEYQPTNIVRYEFSIYNTTDKPRNRRRHSRSGFDKSISGTNNGLRQQEHSYYIESEYDAFEHAEYDGFSEGYIQCPDILRIQCNGAARYG